MGRTWIEGFLDQGVGLDKALKLHLTGNHYPPVPLKMLEPCKKAIKNALAGNYDKMVKLPAPIKYRGASAAPTYAVIDAHHLDVFLEKED